jgi:hypothetical protein
VRESHKLLYKQWFIPPLVKSLDAFSEKLNPERVLVGYLNEQGPDYVLVLGDDDSIKRGKLSKPYNGDRVQFNESDDESD